MYFTLDREIIFKEIVYKALEVLDSDNLLVVKKEDYEAEDYPLVTYVIPGR